MKDLGCINSWYRNKEEEKEYEQIRKDCYEKGHKETETKLGNCYHRMTCEICGYTYTVDSSG